MKKNNEMIKYEEMGVVKDIRSTNLIRRLEWLRYLLICYLQKESPRGYMVFNDKMMQQKIKRLYLDALKEVNNKIEDIITNAPEKQVLSETWHKQLEEILTRNYPEWRNTIITELL